MQSCDAPGISCAQQQQWRQKEGEARWQHCGSSWVQASCSVSRQHRLCWAVLLMHQQEQQQQQRLATSQEWI
jgi:hypothetical protein